MIKRAHVSIVADVALEPPRNSSGVFEAQVLTQTKAQRGCILLRRRQKIASTAKSEVSSETRRRVDNGNGRASFDGTLFNGDEACMGVTSE